MSRQPTIRAAAAAVATATAGAFYFNNRYGISKDIGLYVNNKQFVKSMNNWVGQLGDNVTVYHMLELANQDASALWFEGRSWTYGELKMDIDKLASIFQQHGVIPDCTVAVFMTNTPEMVIAYYALCRLGAIPAMINSSLRSQTLSHCMTVAKAKLIVSTSDLTPAILDLYSETSITTPCTSLNLLSFPPPSIQQSHQHFNRITQIDYSHLFAAPKILTPAHKKILKDTAVLVYTSGTSGHPKAVAVKHFLTISVSCPLPIDTRSSSKYFPLRTYSCLPLFHATALFTALYYCVGNSATFCLGRKFSARTFTRELYESKATRILYVGELCRYLLHTPPSDYDRKHKVIVASGNGMAKDIWLKFRDRFGIPEIREFYRSTEGVARLDNFSRFDHEAGFVGFQGLIGRWNEETTYIVKYDTATQSPWRDSTTGFCVTVQANEPGEVIGRVRTMDSYNEYLDNPKGNADKLIRDVFEKGDLFQRTGDLLVRNPKGWIAFADRTGDTFRWRGENVSCGEVRDGLARVDGVGDVAVWGTKLEGYDGQAGAAAISLTDTANTTTTAEVFMRNLYPNLRKAGLAIYQIPRLIRVTDKLDTGATFKHAKEVMKKKSWDPDVNSKTDDGASERLYWLNGETFMPLDSLSWGSIRGGKARL